MRIWIALLVIAALARPGDACQCQEFSKQLDAAQLVFTGTITKVDKRIVQGVVCSEPRNGCGAEYTYRVRVDGIWKGKPGAVVSITEQFDDCSHQLPYKTSERLVFVLREPGQLHGCDGTQPAKSAALAAVTKRLGSAHKP
ncbi:MAG TPA: hypothetical protein VFQ53_22815 [Kofleriaceae bacterium]|nr:hypothetical protein [Kofleriaceae bacterium]